MYYKQFLLALTLALSAAFTSAETSIAVVDFQRVLFQSSAAQQASADLQPEISAIQQRIVEIETKINALQATIQNDADTLTDDDLLIRQNELDQLANERLSTIQFGQQKQTSSRNEFVNTYKTQVQEIVASLSQVRGFNLVIDLSTVVYLDGVTNITDDVLAAFDNQYTESLELIE